MVWFEVILNVKKAKKVIQCNAKIISKQQNILIWIWCVCVCVPDEIYLTNLNDPMFVNEKTFF